MSELHAKPAVDRRTLLDELDDEDALAIIYDWRGWARPSQLPPDGSWRVWLVLSGRGFGKTRLGAEWVREQVRSFEFVNLIAKSRDEYRDVMIEGESGIMECCLPHERPVWLPTRRLLKWPNGAKTLCFTAEEPDQLRGPQHQRLWGDEFAKWPYMEETWKMATLGLRLPPDPRALLTTTPQPKKLIRDLVENDTVVVTAGTSYENRANLDPEWFSDIINVYKGTKLERQEINAELLFEEGLAYKVKHGVHVVPADTPVSNWWDRFEAMDYGTASPTSWGCFAVDHDGNVIAHGLYHSPGYPADHAKAVWLKREKWWARNDKGELVSAVTFGPVDLNEKYARDRVTGREVTPATEFSDFGIFFATAQQDRRAGYLRIAGMLAEDPDRPFPDWHPLRGEKGSPRLFVVGSVEMEPLVQALLDAPLEDEDSPLSKLPGEAVDHEWERRHGHAHAMLRYAVTSKLGAPPEPEPVYDDPRQNHWQERLAMLERRELDDLVEAS